MPRCCRANIPAAPLPPALHQHWWQQRPRGAAAHSAARRAAGAPWQPSGRTRRPLHACLQHDWQVGLG